MADGVCYMTIHYWDQRRGKREMVETTWTGFMKHMAHYGCAFGERERERCTQ